MIESPFAGCIPALMTPCNADRTPNFDALVRKGRELIDHGMSAVVYAQSLQCGHPLSPHSPSKSLILLSGSQYFRYKSWC